MPVTLSARGLSLLASTVRQTACPIALIGIGGRFPKARAAGYETTTPKECLPMDETITTRRQADLAESQKQIETSRKMIGDSMRWLTAYRNSVNRQRQNPSLSEGRDTPFHRKRESPVILNVRI